jgi:hypothetical protein
VAGTAALTPTTLPSLTAAPPTRSAMPAAASAGAAAAAAVAADKASKTKLLTDLANEVSALKKVRGEGQAHAERAALGEKLTVPIHCTC